MSLKSMIKAILPKPLHYAYNRLVSRKKIRQLHGDWFDLEWKHRAANCDDETWRKVYNESWENWSQQDLSPIDLQKIDALIPENVSVLDAGCGDGYLLEALRGKGRTLSGIDLSEVAIVKARERLGTDILLQASKIEQLPFQDKAFDVVVSAHTLEHVREFEVAIAELRRVCTKRLIILVPSQEYLPYTEDYHLHFFPHDEDLLRRVNYPGAHLERYTVPTGICAYSGDILLLWIDFV